MVLTLRGYQRRVNEPMDLTPTAGASSAEVASEHWLVVTELAQRSEFWRALFDESESRVVVSFERIDEDTFSTLATLTARTDQPSDVVLYLDEE